MQDFWSGEVELGASGLRIGLKVEAAHGALAGGKVPPDRGEGGIVSDMTQAEEFV